MPVSLEAVDGILSELDRGRAAGLRGGSGRRPSGSTTAVLTHPSLRVVDEIGYLPINRSGAVLFFQLMNRRYEHASTVLTSNKGFEEWARSSATT